MRIQEKFLEILRNNKAGQRSLSLSVYITDDSELLRIGAELQPETANSVADEKALIKLLAPENHSTKVKKIKTKIVVDQGQY